VFDPRGVYPSEQPPTAAALTPALHGNGFWNTGVMDTVAGTPLPGSNSVTFGAPGKYDFYCLIHPFMKATVTVQ
jgi:plastocyanin